MKLRRALLFLILILMLSVIHLSIYTRNINLKYEAENLKRTLVKIQNNLRYIRSVAAEKKDLNRIENIAVSKLKMIRPEEINYITAPTK